MKNNKSLPSGRLRRCYLRGIWRINRVLKMESWALGTGDEKDTFQAEGLAYKLTCEEGGWRLGTR